MRLRTTTVALLLMAAARPEAARASAPRIQLDRVDATSCAAHGWVRVFFTELELEGTVRTFPAESYHLVVDERVQSSRPQGAQSFGESEEPLELAVVLQNNLAYAQDSLRIAQRLQAFLRQLPGRARVSVLPYGADVRAIAEHQSGEEAARALGNLPQASRALAPLYDALRAAIEGLGPAETPSRRALVVVSDGIDDLPERDRFRAIGNLARLRGVPIYPIAYSPIDERAPLLNLGEIAKRSAGTFRWAKSAADLGKELDGLAEELARQHVLRFSISDHCETSHAIQVSREGLRSNVRTTLAVPSWIGRRARRVLIGAGAFLLIGLVVFGVRAWKRRR